MTTTTTSKWLKHTQAKPCPICGRGDRCQFTNDGAHRCFRATETPPGWKRIKQCKDGTGIYRIESTEARQDGVAFPRSRGALRKKSEPTIDWAAEAERMTANLTVARLQQLTTTLGVTAAALQAIGCGWADQEDLRRLDVSGKNWHVEYPDGAWSFPERDAKRQVVGISFRAVDGRKGSPKGAKRGLIIPTSFSPEGGPLLVAEGASDVAALLTMNIPAVGRPSNCGGGDALAALLPDHDVVVVGENDERLTDGGEMLWPGRTGAQSIARTLACRWKRSVRMALPAKPDKDVRAWFNGKQADLNDAGACQALGRQLIETLEATSELVEPTPPELTIRIERLAGAARANIYAAVDGRVVHVDEFKPTSEKKRKAFAQALIEKEPALGIEAIEAKLLELVAEPQRTKRDSATPESPQGLLAASDEESRRLLDAMTKDVIAQAEAMLMDPGLINRIVNDIVGTGVVGEQVLAMTVYLLGVSRLLDDPLSAIVQGPSSSGKSYVIQRVAGLFPPEALLSCTTMTPQALYYLKNGRLMHRWVVAGERSRVENDDTAEATRALREMISAKKLVKAVTVKNGGQMETIVIEQDGPIAYIESTTLTTIFDEDANRCLLLATDESSEQTRRIVMTIGAVAAGTSCDPSPILARHHALQRLLRRVRVIVPYAEALADRVPDTRTEARRAFPHVLQMVKVVALLHQRQRAAGPLSHGDMIRATIDDYKIARRLLEGPMARAIGGAVASAAVRLGERLRERYGSEVFDTTQATREDGVKSRGKMSEYLGTLQSAGQVVVEEPGRGNKPSTWRMVADPPRAESDCLPDGEDFGGAG